MNVAEISIGQRVTTPYMAKKHPDQIGTVRKIGGCEWKQCKNIDCVLVKWSHASQPMSYDASELVPA